MIGRAKQIFEVLILRSVPGFLNLFTLFLIAGWIDSANYGLFSTIIATTGTVSNVALGILLYSFLALHAAQKEDDRKRDYERQYLGSVIFASTILAVLVSIPAALEVVSWAWILPVPVMCLYMALQEIHHANLRFYRFAISAFAQAFCFLLLSWFLVRPEPNIDFLIVVFVVSYGFGGAISWILSGVWSLALLNRSQLKEALDIGGPITLGTLALDAFILGFRYVFIWLGMLHELGVFSFAVDTARRLIGVVINAASFALIPRAYRANSNGDRAEFASILKQGLAISVVASVLMSAIIIFLGETKIMPAFDTALFNIHVQILVIIGVVLNRAGKMVLTPVVVTRGVPIYSFYGYLIAGPVALFIQYAALKSQMLHLAYFSYAIGFGLWIFVAFLLISRKPFIRQEQT